MKVFSAKWSYLPIRESFLPQVFHYAVYRVGPSGISHPYNSDLKPLPTPRTVYVITPSAYARGKAISFVRLSVCRRRLLSPRKSPDLNF